MTMAAQKPAPLPGTRPPGATDEGQASARVRDMFMRIAPRYDFLNHLLSLSLDRVWRRRTAKHFLHILSRPDARVLDLCCGTGDLTFALDRARDAVLAGLTVASSTGGEELIAAVYNAVRGGPGWRQTLLVITYNEHGGCYDHVVPPAATDHRQVGVIEMEIAIKLFQGRGAVEAAVSPLLLDR